MGVGDASGGGPAFRVRQVAAFAGRPASWTLVAPDHRRVEPVERYLAWLTNIERSPRTVEAYARDLKAFWSFLAARGLGWQEVTPERLGDFVAWLRQPADNVIVLSSGTPRRQARTVNRMLTSVVGFYEHEARGGNDLAKRLLDRTRGGRGSYKPFLHGIARLAPRGRVGRLPEPRRLPATLTLEQVAAILGAQARLRDRFLFALLFTTGMRIGQALGLRHEDVVPWEQRIRIVAREDNANGARAKRGEGSVPAPAELFRLHADYMHAEYGELDSDYVFVNLWAGRIGRPMTYRGVQRLVRATERRVGFRFTPHQFRHTYATLNRRGGMRLEVLSELLTHRSLESTRIYDHATLEDLRAALAAAGSLERARGVLG